MRDAVIVSTARTGIGRTFKGSLNAAKSPSMTAHAIAHAVARAGVDAAEVDDVVIGCVLSSGTAGMNLARNALLAGGLPATVAGQTMDRQCASGLMAIATAAKQVIVDAMDVVVAGGHDSISAVQDAYMAWVAKEKDPNVIAHAPNAYMPMLQTAEFVAKKYGISRDAQDRYTLESQRRTAAAHAAGRFDAEIVPITTTMAVADKATGELVLKEVTLDQDEGNRPGTTLEGLNALKPVLEGGVVTAGNASQLSDGASACVIMDAALAARREIRRGVNVRGRRHGRRGPL
jgi:acetyl-CoA C-acetyltransferase